MGIGQKRTILWILGGTCLAGSVAALVAAAVLPLVEIPRHSSPIAPSVAGPGPSIPTAAAFEPYVDLDLRRPLNGESPTTNPSSPGASNAPRLMGIVIENGRNVAYLSDSAGQPQYRTVGQQLDEWEIVEIQREGIKLRANGREIELKLAPPESTHE